MQGIAEAIKYFYQEFILRDVLAYVTPGAIIVGCVLLLQYKDLAAIISILKDIPFVASIPIFGALFLIGFGLQNLGEMIGLLKWHERVNDEEHLRYLQAFHDSTRSDESGWLERTRERISVKKNASGTVAMAFGIVLILVSLTVWNPSLLSWAVMLLVVLLSVGLYRGHRRQRQAQATWESLSIDKAESEKRAAST